MARLREGRANTARGAAHFLRETVERVRYAGAKGQLTVRAGSGFYAHSVVSVCGKTKVRFSITIRQRQSLRNLIEAIPSRQSQKAFFPAPGPGSSFHFQGQKGAFGGCNARACNNKKALFCWVLVVDKIPPDFVTKINTTPPCL